MCEIVLNEDNTHLFEPPSYNLIYKNIAIQSIGGVALCIRDNIQYILREDLSNFAEDELEYILIEFSGNGSTTVVDQIYSIPNSYVTLSIQHYESILNTLVRSNHQGITICL